MARAEFKEESPLQIIEFGQEFSPFKVGHLFLKKDITSTTFLLADYIGHVALRKYGNYENGFLVVEDQSDKERPWKFSSYSGPTIYKFVPYLLRVTTQVGIKGYFNLAGLELQSLGKIYDATLYFTNWAKQVPFLEGLPIFMDPAFDHFDQSEILGKIRLKFEQLE